MTSQRFVGTVCKISQLKDKGFGFIKPQDGGKNMFFHVSGGGNEHAQSLVKGEAVSYLPARNLRGPCAIFIKAETDETSPDDTPLETVDAG
jgi:cold shock CspA family protein